MKKLIKWVDTQVSKPMDGWHWVGASMVAGLSLHFVTTIFNLSLGYPPMKYDHPVALLLYMPIGFVIDSIRAASILDSNKKGYIVASLGVTISVIAVILGEPNASLAIPSFILGSFMWFSNSKRKKNEEV